MIKLSLMEKIFYVFAIFGWSLSFASLVAPDFHRLLQYLGI